ncbi:MAG: CAP domain-containing protein [Candidatus Acidiferrum sp.]
MQIGRSFGTAAAVTAALWIFFFSASAHSQDRPPLAALHPLQPSADERLLLDDANRERAAAGLQPVKWNEALAAAALEHARVMARENLLTHQASGELPLEQRAARSGARFSLIAENVAIGPSAESIHDGWMHSPGHRKNILNPAVTAVGIATIRETGDLFAVQDFSRPVADLSLEQQEGKVIALLKEAGLPNARATNDARRTCRMDRGYAGPNALYLIRFEVADLDELPGELLQRIKNRQFRSAAVGACAESDAGGFTRYRIAVLLN